MLVNNYNEVLNEVNLSCEKVGRAKDDVTLIAVSKTKPASDIQTLYDYGVRDFGENKVQELTSKYEELPKDIRWHLIGHLQTNKVKYIVDKVYLIHSVDSVKLAMEIEKEAENILNKFSEVLDKIPDSEETRYIVDNLNRTREDVMEEKNPEKILRNAHIDKEGNLKVKKADWI